MEHSQLVISTHTKALNILNQIAIEDIENVIKSLTPHINEQMLSKDNQLLKEYEHLIKINNSSKLVMSHYHFMDTIYFILYINLTYESYVFGASYKIGETKNGKTSLFNIDTIKEEYKLNTVFTKESLTNTIKDYEKAAEQARNLLDEIPDSLRKALDLDIEQPYI